MNIADLQARIGVTADGIWGGKSRAGLIAFFTTAKPTAAPSTEIEQIADRLGCSLRQLTAVGAVESSGGGFDREGKPKILFERHYFHRLTDGKYSQTSFSDPVPGGYGEDSWSKLGAACAKDPAAAFASASWGRFQIMGAHFQRLGYPTAFDLAASLRGSETGHYELLARFIESNGLKDELRALSHDPEACRAFARAYNGPAYEKFSYHQKLARALS